MKIKKEQDMASLSRRDVLKLTALSLGALLVMRCAPEKTLPAATRTAGTATRQPPAPTETPQSTPEPTVSPDLPRETEVLVIGAGMAGLSAARRLKELDYDVILLEARQRFGGRVWTERSLGLPLDLGASWIHGVNGNPLTALADQVNAQRVETNYDSLTIFNTDGAELSDAEATALEADYDNLMAQIAEWQDAFDNDVSLQAAIDQYLSARNFSPEALRKLTYSINTTIEHEYAADVRDLSMFWFDDAGEYSGGDVIFPQGYDQLTQQLADGLDIRLDESVQRISYGADGVRVQTQSGEYAAQKVVVTLPVGVLQKGIVQFEPPLPAKKQSALKQFGFGVLNKVYLRFSEAFWDSDSHLLGYISEEKGHFCEWLNLAALIDQPVLLGFNAGSYGLEFESLSDAEILSAARETLGLMLGQSIPEPQGWLITRWGQDPFTFGSYSSLKTGATPDNYGLLAAPVDETLFFAGEATHREHPATVHGAYLSGQRAAQELDDSW